MALMMMAARGHPSQSLPPAITLPSSSGAIPQCLGLVHWVVVLQHKAMKVQWILDVATAFVSKKACIHINLSRLRSALAVRVQ